MKTLAATGLAWTSGSLATPLQLRGRRGVSNVPVEEPVGVGVEGSED